MAECSRCGDCCDPVQFDVSKLTERFGGRLHPISHDFEFIRHHWHDNGDGTATCDQFDRERRLCGAHDRPPVCRGFPWYGREVGVLVDDKLPPLGYLPRCAYWADVPREKWPAWVTVELVPSRGG